MQLSLLLPNKIIFLRLFLFLSTVFKYTLRILLPAGNTRLILAIAIPTGAPTTVENGQRETPQQVKSCQHN